VDRGEAASGTPDGSGRSTLADLLDQGSRLGGRANRGPRVLGGPLDARALAADALRLAEGQRAATVAALGPYSHGRGRRIGYTTRSGHLPFETVSEEASGGDHGSGQTSNKRVAKL
jgi:hypothetical protein